jgi:hypothetical protein
MQLHYSKSDTGTIADAMSCHFSGTNRDILQAIFKRNTPGVDCCNYAKCCTLEGLMAILQVDLSTTSLLDLVTRSNQLFLKI